MLEGEGKLTWDAPTDENCHLEISVSDAGDQRFIPYLEIMATLTPEDGTAVGAFEVPFVWHPGLYHYGTNIKVPGDGTYKLDVTIRPPTFMRHDEVNKRCRSRPGRMRLAHSLVVELARRSSLNSTATSI